ncbi:MAG: alpha/beta hydrolase [Natronomonas sp.]
MSDAESIPVSIGSESAESTELEVDIEHNRADVGSVELHYVTAGDPENDPIVFLHGFPECWWAWHRHIDRLADRYRLIVPDMRGYNRSEKPFEVRHYRLETLASDVVGLIDAEGHERAHVVGHDWGGVVAFGTALRRPEAVDRLVVCNAPYPGAFDGQLTLEQALRSWYAGFFQLPAVPERLLAARNYALLKRPFREDPVVEGAYTGTDLGVYERAWSQPNALRSMVDYYRAFGRENIRELWEDRWDAGHRVRSETLLLWGDDDRYLGSHIPNVLQRELSDITVEIFPEATHWLHAEFPDRTAESMADFLG